MIKLPNRYENLDTSFRGRLRPSQELLGLVKKSFNSMKILGGIRFLPLYGESGCGKTSAARELSTHLPTAHVFNVPKDCVENVDNLVSFITKELKDSQFARKEYLIAIIDEYEEEVASKNNIPSIFVESLSRLDRGSFKETPILFIWLTTSRIFQKSLSDATSRNSRVLVQSDFALAGPSKKEWPDIINDTFKFHNHDKDLEDFGVILTELEGISDRCETIGAAIEGVSERLFDFMEQPQDLSQYMVVMLWPVTDGQRIAKIELFAKRQDGYKLDWSSWYRNLNDEDKRQLPLKELNRARLYFDLRLVPIAVADLHKLCNELDNEDFKLQNSYLKRFRETHFFSIVNGDWENLSPSALRERESKRSQEARAWYETVTKQPTKIGKRLAKVLTALNVKAAHEQEIRTDYSSVQADVLAHKPDRNPSNIIIELKVYSPENTVPSSISAQVRTTLKRHAQLAGFLPRQ